MIPIDKNPIVRGWFEGRRVLVLGLGKSGTAAACLLARLGARVAVTEKKSKAECREWIRRLPPGVEVENGTHHFLSRSWDLLIASPGVPPSLWARARARGVPVWGELELGYRALSLAGRWPVRSAAITGTNGKTTTTALLGAILKASGRRTVVAGNIGVPLCAVVNQVDLSTALVLEVSSYQLETAEAFHPTVGAVLNVTPDHLARHKSLASYAAAKFRLFQSQRFGESAVLNAKDPWCRRLGPSVPGKIFWFGDRVPPPWKAPRYLPGRHNSANACAAVACARALGVPPSAIARALATFRGVEHRLEFVRTWRGVNFVNDSKATNVDSTRVALEAIPKPLMLIMGGQDKGAPYGPLVPVLRKKAKRVLLIGKASEKIERELLGRVPVSRCGTVEKAVDLAARMAAPGDVVLLSPACASFDQFENFEHRGRVFKEHARAL
jgi:UDP-N-acetylmuramoylalanine--D-glutamate ligase